VQQFCDFTDVLVGAKVGEVMMKNLQARLGREDGAWLRKQNPQASLDELIRIASEWGLMAGFGATQATLGAPGPNSVTLSVSNPAVKGSKGAAKAFLFAWWAGMITSFLRKAFDYENVVYDEAANTMKCEVVPRGSL
jgi:hypothetical protein